MRNYHNLISRVLNEGERREDRTGTGTIGIFNAQLEYDLANGFPLLTTKRMSFKSIIAELCWFINGRTDLAYLHKYKCTIWDEWANSLGDFGPIYGAQWRGNSSNGVDQLAAVFQLLKTNPFSRRHIVSAWNVEDLKHMALPPCHFAFQFYVSQNDFAPKLHLKVHQRSADLFLGVPYNIASYAALLHFFAQGLNYDVGRLILDMADVHIYLNHVEQCHELLRRDPDAFKLPELQITPPYSFTGGEVVPEQFSIHGYQCYDAIKAPISV